MERTGNGKEHGTTRLIPNREFIVEKNFMMPYYGTPQPPQEYMTEYHVRKDNTVQYRGNYYSVPSGTYRSGETTVWLQEAEGCLELYSKDTGKLLGRHPLNMGRGKIIYDENIGGPEMPVHRNWRNASLYMYLITRKSPYGWKICAGERNATTGVTWK